MGWPGVQGFQRLLTERKEGANAHIHNAEAVSVARSSLEQEEKGGGQPPPSFTAWIYQSYLNLTEGSGDLGGNPQTEGLVLAKRAYFEEDDEIPRIHGLFTPSTRVALVNQARTPQFHAVVPSDVKKEFRTPAWEDLAERYANFRSLNAKQQARLLWLLHRLHMHHAILRLDAEATADNDYIYALALFAVSLDEAKEPEIDALVHVFRNYPGTWASVEATYHLAAHYGKMKRDLRMTEIWAGVHKTEIMTYGVDSAADPHTAAKLFSRYNRVYAFVPQLQGNYEEMTRIMDAAESFAGAMYSEVSDEQRTEKDVIHCALYESRAKEALLIGDKSKALKYADKFVGIAPRFPLAHMCRGQVLGEMECWSEASEAFRLAALYGPPCTERALFYRGNCFEQMNRPDIARDCYLASLDSNPYSDAAYFDLQRVATAIGDSDIAEWARLNFNAITV